MVNSPNLELKPLDLISALQPTRKFSLFKISHFWLLDGKEANLINYFFDTFEFAEQANQQMMHSMTSQHSSSVVSTPTGECMPQPFQNMEQGKI